MLHCLIYNGTRKGISPRTYTELGHAAHWASWVDFSIAFYKDRTLSPVYDKFIQAVHSAQPGLAIRRLKDCEWHLQNKGYEQPSWEDVASGSTRPFPDEDERLDVTEGGYWSSGWQSKASTALIRAALQELEQISTPQENAVTKSSGGPMSRWLIAVPKSQDLVLDNATFLTGLRRRFHKAVPPCPGPCCAGCTEVPDELGHHRATCRHTGFYVRRHYEMVDAWEKLFKISGGRVQREVSLSETALGRQLPEDDARRMDMVVHGLGDLYDGKPMFCDVTVVSPLTGRGIPRRRSDRDQGAVLQLEKDRKNQRYPEVATSQDVHWLVLGHEIYGYTLKESKVLVRKLANHKSRSTNSLARRSAQILWTVRFWDILACTLIRSVAKQYAPVERPDTHASIAVHTAPYLEDLL